MELSLNAKRWLRKRRKEYNYTRPNTRVSKGATLTEILAFCEEHSIDAGTEDGAKHFYFRYAALQKIRDHCNFTIDTSELDRRQTAKRVSEEKQAGVKPTDYRVLAAFKNQQLGCSYDCSQLTLEVDIRKLHIDAFSHFIAVENRDSFYDWHQYHLAESFENPLVVYRGNDEEGKWFAYLRSLWQQQQPKRPTIYFGDFDLPGMRIAMQYDQWLLPKIDWLREHVTKAHFEAKHEPFKAGLEAECPTAWRPLLDLMVDRHKALRQQWMFETKLFCFVKAMNE